MLSFEQIFLLFGLAMVIALPLLFLMEHTKLDGGGTAAAH